MTILKSAIKTFVMVYFVCTLLGCSLISPVKSKPHATYLIDTLPVNVPQKHASRLNILVNRPETLAVFDTTQIAYSKRLHQVNYYAQNRWGGTPAQMLQPLLVRTLQKTHHFHSVVSMPFAGRYDYILNTQILKLIQDFRFCPALLKLDVSAQLIKATNNRVIATTVLNIVEPLPTCPPYGGIIAANHATAKLLERLAYFTIQHTP